jgi:membrane associated rhomboid family serine protease
MSSAYPVTNAMIAINVGVFVWGLALSFGSAGFNTQLTELQYRMVISQQFIDGGEWYRLVSSGFVHFGFLHIAMNMFLLYQLGRLLEPAVGSLTFGLVYFASLLAGSTGALVLSPNAFTGGASGAVFGLMAAGVVGMRQRGLNPLQTGLGLTFVINLVFTLAIPGVSIGGHFGGALAGALCGAVALAPARWRLPSWSANVVAIGVGVLAVLIAATPRL